MLTHVSLETHAGTEPGNAETQEGTSWVAGLLVPPALLAL